MGTQKMVIDPNDIKIRKIQPPTGKVMKDKKKYSRKDKHKKCPEGGIFLFAKKGL